MRRALFCAPRARLSGILTSGTPSRFLGAPCALDACRYRVHTSFTLGRFSVDVSLVTTITPSTLGGFRRMTVLTLHRSPVNKADVTVSTPAICGFGRLTTCMCMLRRSGFLGNTSASHHNPRQTQAENGQHENTHLLPPFPESKIRAHTLAISTRDR